MISINRASYFQGTRGRSKLSVVSLTSLSKTQKYYITHSGIFEFRRMMIAAAVSSVPKMMQIIMSKNSVQIVPFPVGIKMPQSKHGYY
jgi:hypothetical protein